MLQRDQQCAVCSPTTSHRAMHDMSNARAMHDPDMFKVSHCIRQAEEQRENGHRVARFRRDARNAGINEDEVQTPQTATVGCWWKGRPRLARSLGSQRGSMRGGISTV